MTIAGCICLRVRPCAQDPSKQRISQVRSDDSEITCNIAQGLWDAEKKLQKDIGIEKFSVHTFLMPPQVDDNKGRTLRKRTILAVEFVDSGRQYLFQLNDGISQWCFAPTLGGVNFGQDSSGSDRNLDGFKSHKHSFFLDDLVPVTTRTFRCLVALLQLCRPESICYTHFIWHDHYVINIYLEQPGENLDTVCTTHIICGDMELENLFHSLCCAAIGDNHAIAEIDLNGKFIAGRRWTYEGAAYRGTFVDECGWSSGHIVRLVPFPSKFSQRI